MSLLNKFERIEAKNNDRISAADKLFCEVHQEAYNAARNSFAELKVFWHSAVDTQSEIFYSLPNDKQRSKIYLSTLDKLSTAEIREALEKTQEVFISTIVQHFNETYTVSVSCEQVLQNLLPQKPDGGRRSSSTEEWKDYHKQMRQLSLRYETVLDQIFVQLCGRSFVDRALDEIKEQCHSAAWNTYRQTASYEIKKDILRLGSYACKFTDWRHSGPWELQDGTKSILKGIAHFETNCFNQYPHGFSEIMGWGNVKEPLVEFPTCEKIVHLKMFKNNRVDIKFASALLAKQFSEEYLGLVC